MTSKDLILEWVELKNINDILFPGVDVRGIYFWGFKIDRSFVPYYIGITDNIYERLYQHVNSIIGGKYTIYHKNSLATFNKFKLKKASPKKDSGKLYSPNWPKGYYEFLQIRKYLQEHIDSMVDNFVFSYASIDKSITNKELKEVEKICINQIGIENLQNTRSGESKAFKIKHKGCEVIVQKFKQ